MKKTLMMCCMVITTLTMVLLTLSLWLARTKEAEAQPPPVCVSYTLRQCTGLAATGGCTPSCPASFPTSLGPRVLSGQNPNGSVLYYLRLCSNP